MKPFLKWAGNKYQIINIIKSALPSGRRFIEPFAGSAAVFLNTEYTENLIADANIDLIQTYLYLQKDGQKFIEYCQEFFIENNNKAESYYELRNLFNTTVDTRLKSALFIYLNKHCFNGLCRYNSQNKFNTPFGKYTKPYFPHKEMVYFYQKSQSAVFSHGDFMTIFNQTKPGDVVYCDPPYVPISKTANFTSYSPDGFNLDQQKQLASRAQELAKNGVTVVISNHKTELTEQLYSAAELITFPVQRFISCKTAGRQKIQEILAIYKP